MIDFTVVATVYNDEKDIRKLLNDISKQTYQPMDIIIADGGSIDNTCKIIREYDVKQIHLISGKRCNIAQGLNLAIKAAKTNWIIIMATGNHYESNYFEALILALNGKEKCVDGVYGSLTGRKNTFFGRVYSRLHIHNEDVGIPTNRGVLIKKSIFEEIGYFYEGFVYAGEDAEFYNRALKNNKTFVYTNQTTVVWDTPQNYKDYFKQRDRYICSDLQIYSNNMVFKIYRNHFIYILFLILALVLRRNKEGMFFIFAICLFNVQVAVQKGMIHCVAKNVEVVTNMICFIKNLRYWKNKNKIDNDYIIRKAIKS